MASRTAQAILFLLMLCFWPVNPTYALVRDVEAEKVITAIATPVFKAAGLAKQKIKVRLILNSTPNAFVVDGRHIFIHTGLLSMLATPEALAGVLAHECGHIVRGHISLRQSQIEDVQRLSTLGTILGIAVGAASGQPMAGLGASIGVQEALIKNMLAYSRMQETAADQGAIDYMGKLGLSTHGLAGFLHTMQQEERLFHNDDNAYWRSHPTTRERINMLERHKAHSGQLPEALRQHYNMVIAKIDGFTLTPAQVAEKYKDNSNAALYAKAVASYRQGYTNEALAMVDRLLAMGQYTAYLQELRGQILYENGRIQEAIAPYRKALALMPQEPLLKMELAVVLLAGKKDAIEAGQLLRSALDLEPDNAYAWQQLGIAMSRQGDELGYHLALAKSHILVGDMEPAKRSFSKAQELQKQALAAKHQLLLHEVEQALATL